ncbi:MAG: rhodanese-like domain-containing protein [Candidatus Moranbacteria bacterium]|nr:rhodanese-like domain-containing protein [Candidatus Moranbacteria bacterium]
MLAKDLKLAMQQEGNKYLLVDVREEAEISAAPFFKDVSPNYINIPLTVVAVSPKEEIVSRLETAAKSMGFLLSDAKVMIVCRSGSRSDFAVERLASFGIRTENVDDGRIGWGEPL